MWEGSWVDDINQLDSSGDVSSQSSSDQDVCIKGNCNCRPKTINPIYIYIYIYINTQRLSRLTSKDWKIIEIH